MLFYDLLDLLWLWHTSFLIVMYKLDLLMFHVQSFYCFEHSGVIFSTFYFSYEVFCFFFSLASLTFWFISLSIFLLDFLSCLFFFGSLQFLIWNLMSFCSFEILSRSGFGIWWSFSFFLYPTWVSAHIELCPWAFPICTLAVLLRIRYLISSLYLSWLSSFCVSCLVSNLFWFMLDILWW